MGENWWSNWWWVSGYNLVVKLVKNVPFTVLYPEARGWGLPSDGQYKVLTSWSVRQVKHRAQDSPTLSSPALDWPPPPPTHTHTLIRPPPSRGALTLGWRWEGQPRIRLALDWTDHHTWPQGPELTSRTDPRTGHLDWPVELTSRTER